MFPDDAPSRAGRLLLLGIGNTILSDDGLGVAVARAAYELLPADLRGRVDLEDACTGGFDLVEYLPGYAAAVIADAIKTAGGEPGAVYTFDAADLKPTAHLAHVHGVNLAGALAIADQLQLPIPSRVTVVAVEAADLYTFREELTPAVGRAVEPAARAVVAELTKLARDLP